MKLFVLLTLILLILVSCTKQKLTSEQETYKNKCLIDGKQWMQMSEIKDGMVVGKSCYGCMVDAKNHVCNEKEYEAIRWKD